MTLLAALLVVGILGTAIPSDREIARDIEAAIQAQLHPESVQVIVSRRGMLSTTLQRLEITITGFTAKDLPFSVTTATVGTTPARAEGATTLRDDTGGKQVRIIDLVVTCNNFELQGLPVHAMSWHLHDVRVPMKALAENRMSIAAAQTATGFVTLKEAGVSRYLKTRDVPLDDLTVRLTNDGCRISGKTRTFVHVPVTVSGRLGVRGDAVLSLQDPRLHLSVVRAPGFVTDRVLKGVDPIIDLNADLPLPAPITITNITHEMGSVQFDATMAFPQPE